MRITPWQRLVAIAVSVALFFQALLQFQDDKRFGLSFIAAAVFVMVSLSPPVSGRVWIPNPLKLARRWKWEIFAAIAAATALFFVGLLVADHRQQEDFRTAEAERASQAKAAAESLKIRRAKYKECLSKTPPDSGQIYAYMHELECKRTFDNWDPVAEAIAEVRETRQDRSPQSAPK